MTADTIPANMEWNKIPPSAIVRDLGGAYVATMTDGRRFVIFWGSIDAARAQAFLKKRSTLDLMPG